MPKVPKQNNNRLKAQIETRMSLMSLGKTLMDLWPKPKKFGPKAP